MAIMYITGALALLIYTAVMAKKKGSMPDSLSETAYIGKSRMFTFMIATCATLMTPILAIAGVYDSILSMLFLLGMYMVASSPHYKRYDRLLHYGGGMLAGLATQLIVFAHNPLLLTAWVIVPLWALLRGKEKIVFIAELICYMTISISLIF